jgi:hypothetical protein
LVLPVCIRRAKERELTFTTSHRGNYCGESGILIRGKEPEIGPFCEFVRRAAMPCPWRLSGVIVKSAPVARDSMASMDECRL